MIKWIEDVSPEEVDRYGWLAKNLSNTLETGLNIPKGFVVSKECFNKFKERKNIEETIQSAINNISDFETCVNASEKIISTISRNSVPEDIIEDVKKEYAEINVSKKVREAGSKAINLIGNQRTYETVTLKVSPLNKGEKNIYSPEMGVSSKQSLENSLKQLWKNYFKPENLFYRYKKGLNSSEVAIIVQKSVEYDKSGTVYTRSPNNYKILEMESCYGLITGLKEGEVSGDRFEVERDSGKIIEKDVVEKDYKVGKNPATGKITKTSVPSHIRSERSLSTERFSEVVNQCIKVEKRFKEPVEVEFGINRERVFIESVDPITNISEAKPEHKNRPLVQGIPTTDKTVEGSVKKVYTSREVIDNGIIVSENPDKRFIKNLDNINGIIIEKGGRTNYLHSILSDLGVTGVLRADEALEKLDDGSNVVIKGSSGSVFLKEDVQGSFSEKSSLDNISKTYNELGSNLITVEENFKEPTVYEEGFLKIGGKYERVLKNFGSDTGYILVESVKDVFRADEHDVLLNIQKLGNRLSTKKSVSKFLEYLSKNSGDIVVILNGSEDAETVSKYIKYGVNTFLTYSEIYEHTKNKLLSAEKKFIIQSLQETVNNG